VTFILFYFKNLCGPSNLVDLDISSQVVLTPDDSDLKYQLFRTCGLQGLTDPDIPCWP